LAAAYKIDNIAALTKRRYRNLQGRRGDCLPKSAAVAMIYSLRL